MQQMAQLQQMQQMQGGQGGLGADTQQTWGFLPFNRRIY
jgi:hypothetical protein